jgi:hypothetical protein
MISAWRPDEVGVLAVAVFVYWAEDGGAFAVALLDMMY